MSRPRSPAEDAAAIRAFARPLAHDLGNLLQVVSGNLELLALRTTDEAALRYLANARAAAEQLTELARRLPVDTVE
jgi:signal transduction histidine kinase